MQFVFWCESWQYFEEAFKERSYRKLALYINTRDTMQCFKEFLSYAESFYSDPISGNENRDFLLDTLCLFVGTSRHTASQSLHFKDPEIIHYVIVGSEIAESIKNPIGAWLSEYLSVNFRQGIKSTAPFIEGRNKIMVPIILDYIDLQLWCSETKVIDVAVKAIIRTNSPQQIYFGKKMD